MAEHSIRELAAGTEGLIELVGGAGALTEPAGAAPFVAMLYGQDCGSPISDCCVGELRNELAFFEILLFGEMA